MGRRPVEDPLSINRRQVHAAVGVLKAKLVMPVGGVQRHVFVEVRRPRHVLQEVIIGQPFTPAHLSELHFGKDAEQTRVGFPLRQAG